MRMSVLEFVYILGVGMYLWGKWGNDFIEYGVVVVCVVLWDVGVDWWYVQLVVGVDIICNGYLGFVVGVMFVQKFGWIGVLVSFSYVVCVSGF